MNFTGSRPVDKVISFGNRPVYRLYHKGNKRHLFTSDSNERNVPLKNGWTNEGIGFYVLADQRVRDIPIVE